MCIYFTDLEERISQTLEDLDQKWKTDCMLDFPNYVVLKEEVDELCVRLDRSLYTGLLVIGPKGCGKTTSLYKLSLDLEQKKMKTLYVDLATVKSLQKELHVFIRERADIDVLLIDNVQCFDSSAISFLTVPFFVAASSPGRDSKNVHEFQKAHIDGMVGIVHFSPLDKDWSKKYLEHLGVVVKNETECTGSEQMSTDPPTHSGRVSSLTWQEFLRLVYHTGGIPRYLYTYVKDNEDYLTQMDDEMTKQLDDALKELDRKSVMESITRIALSHDAWVSNLIALVNCEIAYLGTDEKYYLTSPFYMFQVIKEEGLEYSSDWRKLEWLTLFLLKHTDCRISNSKQRDDSDERTYIVLPRVGRTYQQTEIGKFPPDKEQDIIISLASGHPVIDTIVVCTQDKKLYFIQTSFSKYSVHKKKRADLKQTCITKGGDTVYHHYAKEYKGYDTVYVYATPQDDSSSDVDVFFWDLRCTDTMFWWK